MAVVTPPAKPAPDDLRLLQAVVNSRDIETGVDEWADLTGLSAWLQRRRLVAGEVTGAELARASALREALRALLWANNDRPMNDVAERVLEHESDATRVRVEIGVDGRATLQPDAAGVDGLVQAVLAAMATAMLDGRWPRLKACFNDECR